MTYTATVPYTSALPNKLCLNALNNHFLGWRWMLSPASIRSVSKKREYLLFQHGFALDNGAYSYHKRDLPFPTTAFQKCIDKYGEQADWIVLPDVIGDWNATNDFSNKWFEQLKDLNHLMIVAQNGCENNNYKDIVHWIYKGCGIFIGGDDDFKQNHSKKIVDLCKKYNTLCHIGRVNSMKRATWCNNIGAFSFDGSGMARFTNQANYMSKHIAFLHNQLSLFSQNSYILSMQNKYKIHKGTQYETNTTV